MRNNLFIIAKSGWKYIFYALLASVVFTVLDLEILSFLSFLAAGAVAYFFRNPERGLPFFQANALVSPCDGVIVSVDDVEDKEYAYKVDIESSYFDVSILRIPMNAKLSSIALTHGTRVGKKSKLFYDLNEFAELNFIDENGNKIKVVHRLKQSFAPLEIDIVKAQELMQTARYGVMINGVTSIYLPHNFRLNLNVGNEVKASETLVGYFS
ncbi:phosphatidylserine decarboxylase [Sulfurimonas sp.]